jgi:L-asparaginase
LRLQPYLHFTEVFMNRSALVIDTLAASYCIATVSAVEEIERHLKKEHHVDEFHIPRFTVERSVQISLPGGAVVPYALGASSDVYGAATALAKLIEANYDRYDGFVVLHELTVVAVEVSSLLSFMLEGLQKPVIFTGSTVPAAQPHSDLRRNYILALMAVGARDRWSATDAPAFPEVCIAAADTVVRATRAYLRVSGGQLDAFGSPHAPALGTTRGSGVVQATWRDGPASSIAPEESTPALRSLKVTSLRPAVRILTVVVTPSLSRDVLARLGGCTRPHGIVVLAYGAGNVPSRNDAVVTLCETLHARFGVPIVVCTQLRYGGVKFGEYAAADRLGRIAMSAGDMTIETATAKLRYLLGLSLHPTELAHRFTTSLRGELTEERPKRSSL